MVTALYEVVCAVFGALALAAAVAGGLDWWRGGTARAFWLLARATQVVVAVAALLGAVLLLGAGESGRGLQYAYGPIAAGVSFAAEQLRVASAETVLEALGYSGAADVGREPEEVQHAVVAAIARREVGIVTAAMAVIVVLALRGAGAL